MKAMSGMPMIQFSLVSMLQLVDEGVFTLETIVEKCAMLPHKFTASTSAAISVKVTGQTLCWYAPIPRGK